MWQHKLSSVIGIIVVLVCIFTMYNLMVTNIANSNSNVQTLIKNKKINTSLNMPTEDVNVYST